MTTIGLDIAQDWRVVARAKSVFQVHGVDAAGRTGLMQPDGR